MPAQHGKKVRQQRQDSRKKPGQAIEPLSLEAFRTNERREIMRKVKTYSGVLVHLDEIMRNSLMGRKYAEFTMLKSVNDF